MPIHSSDLPGRVEQATAAPGEKRVLTPLEELEARWEEECGALSPFGEVNCELPNGHDGPHRFEWADGE